MLKEIFSHFFCFKGLAVLSKWSDSSVALSRHPLTCISVHCTKAFLFFPAPEHRRGQEGRTGCLTQASVTLAF